LEEAKWVRAQAAIDAAANKTSARAESNAEIRLKPDNRHDLRIEAPNGACCLAAKSV
jgi:hypothetical protein